MFSSFLDFFKKNVQYDIYGSEYRTFIIAFGGMRFGKGLFTVMDKGDALEWEKRLEKAFPEHKGSFRLFGYDWMGRCFGIPASSDERVLLFDPGVYEVYEVSLNFTDFINKAIPLRTNECLAIDAFIGWSKAAGEELPDNRCVGYKVPLFLGGKDEADNFEITDMAEYWNDITAAGRKLHGIPDEEEKASEGVVENTDEADICDEAAEETVQEELSEEDMHFAQQADEAELFFIHQQKREEYIKVNVDVYLEKFRKMNVNNSAMSWNWCAFLFSGPWFLYRKMYKCFILTYVLTLVIGTALGVGAFLGMDAAGIDPMDYLLLFYSAAGVATLAVMVFLGIFSDHWYRKKIDRLIEAGEAAESEEERQRTLKKGGVNIPLMIIYIVLMIIGSLPALFMPM